MLIKITSVFHFEQMFIKKPKIIVFFSGLNCGACKLVDPIINQLVAKHDDIDVLKILTDDNDIDPLINKYSISSIPYFIFFKNTKIITTITGYQTLINFENKINEFFDND